MGELIVGSRSMRLVPVIMSGGAGSRLWPLSRETFPKPFISLPDGETLIRKTFARAAALPGVSRVATVTNRELMFLTADEYDLVGGRDLAQSFILEPFGRDTAPAIALACLHVAEVEGADALVLNLPADHLIPDTVAFARTVDRAVELAIDRQIVLFGIRPTHAETGFGYIEAEGDRLRRFVEKPTHSKAVEYVKSGNFYWNAGITCFQAAIMLDLMEKHCPDLLAQTRLVYAASRTATSNGRVSIEVDRPTFADVKPISIDYAIMEKLENARFLSCDFSWSDVGSWNAMADILEPDENGNRFVGNVMAHNTSGSYVHGEGRLVSLVGVSNLLVIDTADALLVADRNAAQEIKEMYNRLKAAGSETAILHRTAHRPWGSYTVLEEGERFKIKRIEVKPGGRLSLQAHHHRSEHWVVVSGTAKVVNGDMELLLAPNQSTYIPCGSKHRLENPGKLKLVMIEVQSGEYLGEDDIVRFDDIYGRVSE